jgi:hypothetical protein
VTNSSAIQSAIADYIRTGEADPLYSAWPGDWMEKAETGRRELREALLTAVHRSVGEMAVAPPPAPDAIAKTRMKVGPMVSGLFTLDEHEVVLNALERSVVFVTGTNIEHLVFNCSFDGSAWTLANLYLSGAGADLLGPDAPTLVGFSEETTCYISVEYFRDSDPFADLIVHETAHIFHNCKRSTLGLAQTRRKEWLLDINYPMRKRSPTRAKHTRESWSGPPIALSGRN